MPVDIVNVFRTPDALPAIARDAVAIQAGALWCQFGVINEEGARIAEDGGVTVVMDRLKGANIGVGSRSREGWEDRGHVPLLSLPRVPGSAWCACP